ncbi:MAG TPA: ubiquinol-cytochrome C chaperone family protein [Magnetospirillum sp.]|jgi:cytochrome b pre-mRNA-processing protein 3|nr:ubiquinol-cytochrome C chaperone family protein [Magnetospirillum sp.]
MLFRGFFERRRRERAASDLYLAAVNQARQPVFYTDYGVPDSLEGRFDMIILHVWMVLRRLGRQDGEAGHTLGQATVELMFADMDRNLREMGVTDLRVGKRVLNMAEAFYGRAGAYDKALADGEEALAAALTRNLYQSVDPVPQHPAAMAAYVRDQLSNLDTQAVADLLDGKVTFQTPEVGG